MAEETVTLYRAVDMHEVSVIDALRFRAFPPRRDSYHYPHPTTEEKSARELAQNMLNRLGSKMSYVLDFQVKKSFADTLKLDPHDEVLIIENLDELNLNIVELIGVLARYEAATPEGKK